MAELDRQKKLVLFQERNRLHRATRNGVWIIFIPHFLNGIDFSHEEFRDNIWVGYGLLSLYIYAAWDGWVKKFFIEHARSFLRGGLVLYRHRDTAKECGALEAWALTPSAISYKPKINSRTVQGGRIGVGLLKEGWDSWRKPGHWQIGPRGRDKWYYNRCSGLDG